MKQDTILAALDQARRGATSGDSRAATHSLREALRQLWNNTPLYVETSFFVERPADGYGAYQPRASNVYAPGEPIYVYTEPGAYDLDEQDGVYRLHLSTDFNLLTADGARVLGGSREFASHEFRSRRLVTEFMLNTTLTLSGLPDGPYLIELVLHDRVSGEHQASTRLPIVIAS